MPYFYSDPSRESDSHALPDVEVFYSDAPAIKSFTDETPFWDRVEGHFYAFGFPGCLWDSDPVGPFDTEAEALADAQQSD